MQPTVSLNVRHFREQSHNYCTTACK